jgi:Domain of unknown function (DUF222)/HNH endonuclease
MVANGLSGTASTTVANLPTLDELRASRRTFHYIALSAWGLSLISPFWLRSFRSGAQPGHMCACAGGTGRNSGTKRPMSTTTKSGPIAAPVTVLDAGEALDEALRVLSELEARGLTADERFELLSHLHKAGSALHGHFLEVLGLAELYQDAKILGHGTSATILASRLRFAPVVARQAVREARTLREHPASLAALRDGRISGAHVTQIVTGLRAIGPSLLEIAERSAGTSASPRPESSTSPALDSSGGSHSTMTVGRDSTAQPTGAEQILLDLSGAASPKEVRLAAQHLKHTIDPACGEREFARAQDQSICHLSQTLDGRWHLDATLDPESGGLVQCALSALIGERLRGGWRGGGRLPDATVAGAPKPDVANRSAATTGGADREDPSCTSDSAESLQAPVDEDESTCLDEAQVRQPPPTSTPMVRRRAQALIQLAAHLLDSGMLDHHGGARPHLTVTVPLEVLLGLPGAGTTEWGDVLPPSALRRLACDAWVTRVVLDPAGQPLNVGRTRRLATIAQRRALEVRDGGCRFVGCDRPPGWCDAHHIVSWLEGGATDLDNLVLLCRSHHMLVHREGSSGLRLSTPKPEGSVSQGDRNA